MQNKNYVFLNLILYSITYIFFSLSWFIHSFDLEFFEIVWFEFLMGYRFQI